MRDRAKDDPGRPRLPHSPSSRPSPASAGRRRGEPSPPLTRDLGRRGPTRGRSGESLRPSARPRNPRSADAQSRLVSKSTRNVHGPIRRRAEGARDAQPRLVSHRPRPTRPEEPAMRNRAW
ncbi:hypothetical protein GCM10023215_60200 [Pseudonocardia yuanmonensis]|uniref:Uncharacterized protein n=1 Tax=Pseudonocardia yuanmonensis TaxID=1095914 RepID=A0ABP8XLV1_9PSEU